MQPARSGPFSEGEKIVADPDLEKYCSVAVEAGATHARQIHPSSVATAPRVRLKCQFGCPGYGRGLCCPPHTPTPDETRAILDCYRRAILFHIEIPTMEGKGKTVPKIFGYSGRAGRGNVQGSILYSVSLKFCRNGAGFCVFMFPVDEPSESLGQPVNELILSFRVEPGKPLGLHDKPESFNRVEIR